MRRNAYAIRHGSRWMGSKRYSYGRGTYDNWTPNFKYARIFNRAQDAAGCCRGDAEVITLEITIKQETT